jgi:hypothetical protein
LCSCCDRSQNQKEEEDFSRGKKMASVGGLCERDLLPPQSEASSGLGNFWTRSTGLREASSPSSVHDRDSQGCSNPRFNDSEERAARLALLRNHAEIGHSSSTTSRIPTPRKGGKRHHHSAHGANQVFSAVTQESFDSESPDGLKRFKPKVTDSPEYIHNSPSFVSFFHTSLSYPPDQFYPLFGAVHTSL